jgi:hypothetical protein
MRVFTARLIAAIVLSGGLASAQTVSRSGTEVQLILTVADHASHQPAALKADDLTITDGTITALTPLQGTRDIELFLVIDDASNYEFGAKLQELRQFVASQPKDMSIGVAYIHDGFLQIAENPTTDHARSARALRAPSGSKAARPYAALSDLIGRWPQKTLRREIILVSSGIDDFATEGAACVSAETAISHADRAGIVIYALYNPAANYRSAEWSKVESGETILAHVCYETGGEAYFLSHDPVETVASFLIDINEHLAHQYLVKFLLSPAPEGGLQTIFMFSESFSQELMKPDRVWVPATL